MLETLKTDATNLPLEELLKQYKDPSKSKDDDIIEYADAEVVSPGSQVNIQQNNHTVIYSDTAANVTKAQETVDAIVSVINEYNEAFGINLPTEIGDIKKIIYGIASKADRDMYVVALSEVADRVTLATVTSLLVTISTLTEQLSSQAFLNALTVQERVAILREFLDYIMKLNEIRESLKVNNPIIEMKNAIKSSKQNQSGSSQDSKKIDEILDFIRSKR